MVEVWRDLWAASSALKQATRFGLGVLRSNAVTKMTGIKD